MTLGEVPRERKPGTFPGAAAKGGPRGWRPRGVLPRGERIRVGACPHPGTVSRVKMKLSGPYPSTHKPQTPGVGVGVGASLFATLVRAVATDASGCAAARAGPLWGKGRGYSGEDDAGPCPHTLLLGKAGWWVRSVFCRCIPSVCPSATSDTEGRVACRAGPLYCPRSHGANSRDPT